MENQNYQKNNKGLIDFSKSLDLKKGADSGSQSFPENSKQKEPKKLLFLGILFVFLLSTILIFVFWTQGNNKKLYSNPNRYNLPENYKLAPGEEYAPPLP
ncbi:MAG: hypothetical protein PHW72_03345 [Candidatus Pacebacteria bacterium]|nr:hypothetical protein [Candidatus Paceibacterota bacterium]